jgi:hypothetical protein
MLAGARLIKCPSVSGVPAIQSKFAIFLLKVSGQHLKNSRFAETRSRDLFDGRLGDWVVSRPWQTFMVLTTKLGEGPVAGALADVFARGEMPNV